MHSGGKSSVSAAMRTQACKDSWGPHPDQPTPEPTVKDAFCPQLRKRVKSSPAGPEPRSAFPAVSLTSCLFSTRLAFWGAQAPGGPWDSDCDVGPEPQTGRYSPHCEEGTPPNLQADDTGVQLRLPRYFSQFPALSLPVNYGFSCRAFRAVRG